MIYVGIDDTDMPDLPGTNQLAKALVARVADEFRCVYVLRHQLFFDRRVPYTSKNGCASIQLQPRHANSPEIGELIGTLRARMLEWFVQGSDPGLCVATCAAREVTEFGHRCQRQLMTQHEALLLAERTSVFLEPLSGTGDGVIGALAAVGLAAGRDDGRVVVNGDWPDDLAGPQSLEDIEARGIEVRMFATGARLRSGTINVGKRLRPNVRDGRVVLYVECVETEVGPEWRAVRVDGPGDSAAIRP